MLQNVKKKTRKGMNSMAHTIICIGRQYGSGGREIGETLAKKLGVPCYDKLLLQRAAQDAHLAPEEIAAREERPLGLSDLVSGNVFADSAALTTAFYSERSVVYDAERRAILEAADVGDCVIIGRCASAILRESGHRVLSCFLYADMDDRLKRVEARTGLSPKEAARRIAKVDRLRRHYFDFYADTPWGEPASYDLMLSSSRYGIDGAAELILGALRALQKEADAQ